MSSTFSLHTPVLLEEVVQNMLASTAAPVTPTAGEGQAGAGRVFFDGTFGAGGHCQALLARMSDTDRLFAMDLDHEVMPLADSVSQNDKRFSFQQGNYANCDAFLRERGVGQLHAALLDLGVSSMQLDTPERGFSFKHEGSLDMRMDQNSEINLAQWLARQKPAGLANVIFRLGEEKESRRIADSILANLQQIKTTHDLAQVIAQSKKIKQKHHPATRTFQALRMAINDEVNSIVTGIEKISELLTVGGRLLVIAFHSLEESIMRRAVQAKMLHKVGAVGPRLKKIEKLLPSELEISNNPRARSARMSIFEKIAP